MAFFTQEHFESLMSSGDYCDFKIVCLDREFKVHTVVLAANSEFFKLMLSHECKVGVVDNSIVCMLTLAGNRQSSSQSDG